MPEYKPSPQCDLSIIIVNWNVKYLLKGCLKSIDETVLGIKYEIIVVDNASQDGSVAMIRSQFPKVQLIVNDQNHGFARGNNMALSRSRGSLVMLLNPDTVVLPNAFERLIDCILGNPEIGMVGPAILTATSMISPVGARYLPRLKADLLLQALSLRSIPKMGEFLSRRLSYPYDLKITQEVEAISGACMLVRRAALTNVGYLNTNTFHYGEDIEWCLRFRRKGWKVVYVADAKIIHYGGESSKQNQKQVRVDGKFSHQQYYMTRGGKLQALLFRMITQLIEVPVMVIVALYKYGRREIPRSELLERLSVAQSLLFWESARGNH